MKKSYIISAMFALVMVFSMSCETLDESPKSVLAPEGLFTTPEELQAAVNGGYSLLTREEFYGRKLSLALLVRGDMCGIGDPSTSARRQTCDLMQMGVDNGLVNVFWPIGYKILAAANTVINAQDVVSGDEADVNAVVAQAYFLRAYVHYVYMRLFGEIIYMDGQPIDDPLAIQQTSIADSYEGIIADLEYAAEWLVDIPVDGSYPGKAAAHGMLASVHMTRATSTAAETSDWQDALDHAEEVINNEGKYGVALETDYYDIFDPNHTSTEVLFKVVMIANDSYEKTPGDLGGSNAGTDQIASVTGPRGDERFTAVNAAAFGWSAIVPELEVYTSWNGKDYRKAVSLDTAITFEGNPDYYFTNWGGIPQNVARPAIAKYFRAVGESNTINGIETGPSLRDSNAKHIMMRYAEVLLIAAEASVELGNNAAAVSYINRVRARARNAAGAGDAKYPPSPVPADITGTVTIDDVLEERRLELAFEGVRWYDIIRRKKGDVFLGAAPALETRNFDPARDYLWPKFDVDVTLLDGLTQNPGY
ncbi:RagB/SusD family nutrient uptake outer membrane protein [Reichenbachiella agariperforans]|nr:RagB/SusD family nutrient uptake outer membrane protein [Reichenbachiella agariperforans]MBU2915029.1 RagB/SusD family nutrient uptake outer membrane protein [Reichenbachiella agariperforans]